MKAIRILAVVFSLAFLAVPAQAALIDPIYVAGNPTFEGLWDMHHSGTDYPGFPYDFKIEPVSSGLYEGIIDITVYESEMGPLFDFTATAPIVGLIVKGGPGANFYHYGADAVTADTGLHAPVNLKNPNGYYYGLSHVDVTATPEPATMLLLGSGLAGLAVVRRKVTKK